MMGRYSLDVSAVLEWERQHVVPIVTHLADEILDEALQLVPRDTESLANSGRVEHEEGLIPKDDSWRVAFGGPDYPYTGDPSGKKTVDYAADVEYGHRTTAEPPTYVPARPFLRPAALHER
jgi:hypothetical protein